MFKSEIMKHILRNNDNITGTSAITSHYC